MGNVTSDSYLICSRCNIHWDIRNDRSLKSDRMTVSTLRPDGTLSRPYLPFVDTGQLSINLDDVPF
jgi:hypothetical protein